MCLYARSFVRLRFTFTVLVSIIFTTGYGQAHLEIIKNSKFKTFKEVVTETENYYKDKDKGKGSGYKQFKRWEYFHRQILRDDENVVDFSLRKYEQLKTIKKDRNGARIGGPPTEGDWQPVGPTRQETANYNGRINTVVVDPANPRIIYAGSPAGGLWRSTDDGQTWHCLTDNIFSFMGITSVVIDPLSPAENRTLYILTGDKDGNNTSYMGIFRSIDNGSTWTAIPYSWPTMASFYKLMLHPLDNKLLFLVNDQGVFQFKVGVSTSWQLKLAGEFTDMEFHPSSPSTIYVSGQSGTYRSMDTGGRWIKTASAIPVSRRMELAVSPANPSLVYLLLGQYDVASLYKSADNGNTYTKVSADIDIRLIAKGQWRYDLAIAASPQNANTIFIGGIDLFRSADGGTTWFEDNMGHVDYHSLDFYHGYLYAGNDGGITRREQSASPFSPWTDLSQNFSVSQIYSIGVNQSSQDHILAGLQDNGTYSIRNQYGTVFTYGDGMECFVDPVESNNWFSSSQQGVLYKGSGSSGSYTEISPPQGLRNWLSPFKMDPTNRMIIYAGYADLWKNTRQGVDPWINMTNGELGLDDAIENFTIAPSNSNFIYVIKQRSIHKTIDGGRTWTQLTNSMLANINNIIVHPQNPNVIWASYPYSDPWSQTPRLLKSINGGNTWTDVSGSLPFVKVTCLVYDNGSPNGIYVGTDEGVYYKDDTLTDWIPFHNGMPYSPITDLEINYTTGRLYASTYGRGAWVTNLYGKPASGCDMAGKITREVWRGITGTEVSAIPVNTPPASVSNLAVFESPSNTGNDYGSRIRGYVCVPESGNYIFWISSDDKSELWLSTDESPARKMKIASVIGATSPRQWNKYLTQQSRPIALIKDKKYYIEALHKEASGGDHLAVGWQFPNGTQERPIAGKWLSPYEPALQNNAPVVAMHSPQKGAMFTAPAVVVLKADAFDSDGTVSSVSFFADDLLLTNDDSEPFEFLWQDVPEGNYLLKAIAFDGHGHASAEAAVTITVEASECVAKGIISYEQWNNVTGATVSSIPLSTTPSAKGNISLFEMPSNMGSNFGTRVSGYVCAPSTGTYVFWIASDDNSELWLSTDSSPSKKSKIASITSHTSMREWTKYATQASGPIQLQKGKSYYIEALHKEGSGVDHLAVGWKLPSGKLERPIPNFRLSPFNIYPATEWQYADETGEEISERALTVFPNPYLGGVLTLQLPESEVSDLENSASTVEIISATGKVVFNNTISCENNCNSLQIHMDEKLSPGIYVVQVILNRRRYVRRLMVNQ